MTEFVREGRYIVFKISHLDEEQLELLEGCKENFQH